MKKIISLFIVMLISFSTIFAQSLAGYKICINPGHGGHDSNDREIPLDNGVTFWESEGNLSKGLYLRDILQGLGASVIMTRTTNNTEDDLALSQIVAIANANNVDYFHAIHSNATGTSTKANYTLILFQGKTAVPTYPGSLTMANYIGPQIYKADRTVRYMVAGDFDFYGTGQAYLGVFKGLNMPGTLSEGSFHDYTPESWRLKNDGYLKHEAYAIARSFLQYFNGGNFKEGIIAGIIRDPLDEVPSSYSPLSGTNDKYRPINNASVRLEPSGKTYTTDNFNNGYYFFDNIMPGKYKVIVEIENMKPDTSSVTVTANESVFSDRMMQLIPNYNPPKIISYSPSDSLNEVSNISPVIVDFDIRMEPTVTQNAFTIKPNISGTFSWEKDYKRLIFTPSKGYTPGQKYVVNVSTSAITHFWIPLTEPKTFSFTTRSKLSLLSTFPKSNSGDISTTVLMRLSFEKGIDGTSLGGRITVVDSLGIAIPLNVNSSKYNYGIVEFEPTTALKNNSLYKIVMKEGITDVEYVKLLQPTTIEFRTEKNETFSGTNLDGFEATNIWQSPTSSPNSKGINAITTTLSILNTKTKSGSYSGRLDYTFTGTTGQVEIAKLTPISLGNSSDKEFGIWVFGDASKNILKYQFSVDNNSTFVQIDTLNWTGWKMKKLKLNQVSSSGAIQFKSILVVQTANGDLSGRIYFDDVLTDVITDVNEIESIPAVFKLEQNYPNPFNPTTTIRYTVPNETVGQIVTLKVYDMLGSEVAALVNDVKAPGSYEVKFNAGSLASGVYIYKIQCGKFIDSKKLMLIK